MLWLLLSLLVGAADPAPSTEPLPIPDRARVIKVYDGDTFTLENGDKVRLRWVNTPERTTKEPYWSEAQQLAERAVLDREVQLIVTGLDARDGYGRILAGIHNGRDNLSIKLLENGLAHLFIIPPEPEDLTPFFAAQAVAKARLTGIWSTDRYQGTMHITSFHAYGRGKEYNSIEAEYLRICNITDGPVNLQGYVLKTKSGGQWVLPAIVVPPAHTVLIHGMAGVHQTDPTTQLHVYLGEQRPIFDNKEEQVTILDPAGQVVDAVGFKVKGE